MSDLENTFGAEFATKVQEITQEKRAEREKISDETRQAIANLAINEDAFKGSGEPMFEYTSENGITHNVLLMQLAEPREGNVWGQVNELSSGAISIPLDYLGQWVWSIFNDRDMARQMEEGEWYIVVGNLTTWEPEGREPQDQLSPVRGVISLEEAKALADQGMTDKGFGVEEDQTSESEEPDPEPEPEPEQAPASFGSSSDSGSEEETSSGGMFGGGSQEEESEPEPEPIATTQSEVNNVVETLADQEEEVWDVTEDHSEYDVFISVVMDHLGLDSDDQMARDQVADMAMDRVYEGPKTEDSSSEGDALF